MQKTHAFYEQKAADSANESIKTYMDKTVKYLKEEDYRCRRFCDANSTERILVECVSALVVPCQLHIVENVGILLQQGDATDLANAYYLLKQLRNGLTPFRDAFESHIVKLGKSELAAKVGITCKLPALIFRIT